MTTQQEEDGIQRVPAYLSHFLLGDFCKGQSGRPLEINVVAEGESSECCQGRSGEEIGGRPV